MYDTELYKKIKKFVGGMKYHYNACYGWVDNNLKIYESTSTACHAGLYYLDEVKYIFSLIYKKGLSEGVAKDYLKLLMESEAFGCVFETKDYEKSYEDGFFVISDEQEINRAMGLLICSRALREYPQIATHAVELYRSGYNPDLALAMGHLIREVNDDWFFDRNTGGHHEGINPNHTSYVKNMVLGRCKTSPKIKESLRYNGVQDSWCTDYNEVFKNLLEVLCCNEGDVLHNSPFHKRYFDYGKKKYVPKKLVLENAEVFNKRLLEGIGV